MVKSRSVTVAAAHKTVAESTLAAVLVGLRITIAASGQDSNTVWREEFKTLDAWTPLTFPKIERHSRYLTVRMQDRQALKAEADASASGLVSTNVFNPYQAPILRWRWRVENVYRNGDATRKDGDDYPIRVYVLFVYDPGRASLGMRAKYSLARRFYGETPPHASLNYIWASRPHEKRILTSPYTDRSRMVVLRAGPVDSGRWVDEEVNILDDYHIAFGEDPPRVARLAIMADADNTGESATAYVEFIELRSHRGAEARP